MMNFLSNIFCIVLFLLFTISCEESTDFYLGINQQPIFEEDSVFSGLNIFGLLRPDFRYYYNKSFVFVQEIYPVLEDNDYRIIKDVKVVIEPLDAELFPEDSILFPLLPSDSLFMDTLYRPNEGFVPVPEKQYKISCIHPSYTIAQGMAVFPSPPEIIKESIQSGSGTIQFTIQNQSSIHMYDIYYFTPSNTSFMGRFVPDSSADGELVVNYLTKEVLEIDSIIVYGYDANLASYYANSNTALNINKYRTGISTLSSGYGVFGALNFTVIYLGNSY